MKTTTDGEAQLGVVGFQNSDQKRIRTQLLPSSCHVVVACVNSVVLGSWRLVPEHSVIQASHHSIAKICPRSFACATSKWCCIFCSLRAFAMTSFPLPLKFSSKGTLNHAGSTLSLPHIDLINHSTQLMTFGRAWMRR